MRRGVHVSSAVSATPRASWRSSPGNGCASVLRCGYRADLSPLAVRAFPKARVRRTGRTTLHVFTTDIQVRAELYQPSYAGSDCVLGGSRALQLNRCCVKKLVRSRAQSSAARSRSGGRLLISHTADPLRSETFACSAESRHDVVLRNEAVRERKVSLPVHTTLAKVTGTAHRLRTPQPALSFCALVFHDGVDGDRREMAPVARRNLESTVESAAPMQF